MRLTHLYAGMLILAILVILGFQNWQTIIIPRADMRHVCAQIKNPTAFELEACADNENGSRRSR